MPIFDGSDIGIESDQQSPHLVLIGQVRGGVKNGLDNGVLFIVVAVFGDDQTVCQPETVKAAILDTGIGKPDDVLQRGAICTGQELYVQRGVKSPPIGDISD